MWMVARNFVRQIVSLSQTKDSASYTCTKWKVFYIEGWWWCTVFWGGWLRRINCIFVLEFFQAPWYLGVVVDLHTKIQCSSRSSSMKNTASKLKFYIEEYYRKKIFYSRLFSQKHLLIGVALHKTFPNIQKFLPLFYRFRSYSSWNFHCNSATSHGWCPAWASIEEEKIVMGENLVERRE